MKNLSLTIIGLLLTLIARADADVPFSISGIQNGDKVTVTISSNSYLETKSITADGDYSFPGVPTGMHYIKVEATGYNVQDAKAVNVNEDGTIEPFTGIKLVVTPIADDGSWTHSWHEDGSIAGYTTTAHINTPPVVEFLGKKIVPSDVPSQSMLKANYGFVLTDEEEPWTQEYAYRMHETMKTIPCSGWNEKTVIFKLTSQALANDITVEKVDGGMVVTISKDAFVYANPFLVNLDGVRGRFFSKRLHNALVNLITDFGADREAANHILTERFGCSIYPPSYEELTASTTQEDAARFQDFIPSELVSIINMFEEMPEGFHKIANLKYLVRRQNGLPHPLYPEAAAVSWCIETGYIEFMESAFRGTSLIDGAQRLILHEKTHFLWAFTFSDNIKNDWIELGGWYKDPNTSSGWATTKDVEFVSAYAHAINPDEDMAESVAAYINEPEKLQSRAYEKYEFIRDRIMHGTRYISKIPDHLTFEVLNLNPDYDYPGKIKSLDLTVAGKSDEDKVVTVDITLNHIDGFEDGASGAGLRITSPMFTATDGTPKSQFFDLGLAPVDGDNFHLRGELTISKYSKTGYWTAGDITVSDMQGNQRFEGTYDFVWNMYVDNALEDLEAPVYEKGSLKYNLTDTIIDGHKAQNLEVTYKVSDNIGVETTFVRIGRNDGSYSFDDFYGTYDETTHTAHINMTVTEFFHDADYYAEFIFVRDTAQTETEVWFTESPQDEPRQYIHITTPNPDTVAPELDLNRIVVYAEPTNKEAPDGETLVTINFYARDDKSGLGTAAYRLLDPQGLTYHQYFYHRNFWGTYFDGDPTVWEKYTIKCVLPQGSAPGIWGLSEMFLNDKAWNERIYNFVETLIFEPDDSDTDYVLFANLDENEMLNLSLTSETLNGYGYTYRIISDETGEEINGTLTAEQRTKTRAAVKYDRSIDISSLPDGKIIVIVNVTDADNKIVAVRSQSLEKTSSVSGIESRLDKTQGEVKSISYYDAAGREFNAPVKGLNIVKVTYVNGTVKTMKVNK